MTEALSEAQVREVEQLSELATRRYFDHYLQEVFPVQQKALREHTHLMIDQHNHAISAHGGVEKRFSRFVWVLIGSATAGGAGGLSLSRLLTYMGWG